MRLIPWLLALALCGCSVEVASPPAASASRPAASTRPAAPAEDGPLVAFLGDSLAAGLHVDSDQAYPAVVQRLLRERGAPFRLINAGVSGDTTAGGLRRVDWILSREPDLVVVELGGNDGLRGTPVASIEENLRGIVERVEAAGARVLLLGMKLPPNYGEDYAKSFEGVFARVAEEEEVAFVPFFLEGVGGVPELNHPDGIHPTARGHALAAENLADALEELVRAL